MENNKELTNEETATLLRAYQKAFGDLVRAATKYDQSITEYIATDPNKLKFLLISAMEFKQALDGSLAHVENELEDVTRRLKERIGAIK